VLFNFGQRPFSFDPRTLPSHLADKPKTAESSGAFGALRTLALAFARSGP
jgi:hypothetical protein